MVYRCSFSNGHQTSSHSSFILGWLVLLLQVKTPTSIKFCSWDIVFATATPSFTSTFASALYQVQYCVRSWWIQTSNRIEVTWTCVKCPTKCSRCWEAWVTFISFPPNHGCVVCKYMYEYVRAVNQKLVGGFLLRLHDLSRGTREALLLLCGFLIAIAYKTKRSSWEHASEGRSLSFPSIASASRISSS